MNTPQENANLELSIYQSIKRRYPDRGKRDDVFDSLMRECFSRDPEYDAKLRRIEEEMRDA